MKKFLSILAFLLFFYYTAFPAGFNVIEGWVTDAQNKPLAGAMVNVIGTTRNTVVQADGSYRLGNIPAGSYEVRISAEGKEEYQQKLKFGGNDTIVICVVLREGKPVAAEQKVTQESKVNTAEILVRLLAIAATVFDRK